MLYACVERFDVMGGRGNILGWVGEVNKARVWCMSGGPNRRIPHSPPRDSQPTSVKCGRVSDSFARFSQCPPSVQPTFQLALYLHQPRPPFARRRRRYGEGKVQGKAHRPPQLLNTRGDR
jgi:hypothetical protein